MKWNPKILHSKPRELLILLDRTLHLNVSFVHRDESEDGNTHVLILSHELEVSYRQAAKKLDSAIIPIMNAFSMLLRPQESSQIFEVSFDRPNPFFGFYVEHLNQEQITHFNLVFTPHLSHGTTTDRVTVTAKTLEIAAGTTDALNILAKAFILLSADTLSLTRG